MGLRLLRISGSRSSAFGQELDIGLVQREHNVLGYGADESGQVFAAGSRPGRVVGVGDEDHPRVGRDRGQHGVQVVAVVFGRHDDELATEHGIHDGIDRKAILRYDHFGAG